MAENDRRPDFEPGTPQGPDLSVKYDGSTLDFYNLQEILNEQSGRIYDRSDFGGIIENVAIDEEKVPVGEDDAGVALTLKIKIDKFLGVAGHDPIYAALSMANTQAFECISINNPDSIANGGTYTDCRYIVTASGMRLVLWYDSTNGLVKLSNNLSLHNVETKKDIVKANPIPGQTLEMETQFEEFGKVAVSLIDSVATKRLNRVYRIGDRIGNLPHSTRGIGQTAMRPQGEKSQEPNGADSDPISHLGDVISSEEDKVSLDDIGGLESIKEELRDVAMSFSNPDVMKKWGAKRPQGILLHGPSGTGKTMLVEALANEINATLIKIQSSNIYVKWLGDSEAKIKKLFDDFKKFKSPTIIFFDEFDAIVGISEDPSAGGADNARNSVAGIFKQEMNNLSEINPNVLIVAATNHQDRIDPSLIRSGRFDHRLYIPMPDLRSRSEIISGIASKLMLIHEGGEFKIFEDDLDVTELAVQSDELSGADIAEIFRRVSLAKAMEEARTGHAGPISQSDISKAIHEFKLELFS